MFTLGVNEGDPANGAPGASPALDVVERSGRMPPLMSHSPSTARFPRCAAAVLLALSSLHAEETAPPDYRFHFEVLAENLPQPMTMQEAPDGRIFFHEIAGKVKVFDPRSKLVTEIGEITVTTAQENGLLGLALDPGFAENQWIYFLHSPVDYDGQYISRFTLKEGKLDPASRKDLLHCRGEREPGQFGGKVLLQRLARSVGSALKARVDFVRYISDQNVRHACIMLSTGSKCNRPSPSPDRQFGAVGARPMDPIGKCRHCGMNVIG